MPSPFEAPDPVELSTLLPGYEDFELVAVGGMGAVYRAQQISLGRDVAIKVLPRELSSLEEFEKSFKAEARAMAKLSHLNLIAVYDFGEVDGMLYLVMEFVDGETLHDMAHGKAVDPLQAIAIVAGAAAGLGHAHQHGILHRDIKPANIFLTQNLEPKLGDFGLAVPADDVGSGLQMGTPGYAAPEVFADYKSATAASDVFSLGMILHELLTGATPTGEEPPNFEHIPKLRGLPKLLQGAINPQSLMRYKNGNAMNKALLEWLEEARKLPAHVLTGLHRPPTLPAPRQLAPPVSRLPIRSPVPVKSSGGGSGGMITIIAVAAALVIGVALILVLSSGGKKERSASGKTPAGMIPETNPIDFGTDSSAKPVSPRFDLEEHKFHYRSLLAAERAKLVEARRENAESLREKAGDDTAWTSYLALVDDKLSELPRHLDENDNIPVDDDMMPLLVEYAGRNQEDLDRDHQKAIEKIHRTSIAQLSSHAALPQGEIAHNSEAWMEWIGADPLEVLALDPAGSWELWMGPDEEEGLRLAIDRKGAVTIIHEEHGGTGILTEPGGGRLKIMRAGGNRFWDLRWRTSWLEGKNESGALVRFRRQPRRFVAARGTPEPAIPAVVADPGPTGEPTAGPDAEPADEPLEDKELEALRTGYREGFAEKLEKWHASYVDRLNRLQESSGDQQTLGQVLVELARIEALDWKNGYLAPASVPGTNAIPRELESIRAKFEDYVVGTLIDLQAAYLAKLRALLARHELAGKDTHELEEEMEPFLKFRRLDLTDFYNARPVSGSWTRTSAPKLSSAITTHHSEQSGIVYEAGGILQLNSGTYTRKESGRVQDKTIGQYYSNEWPTEVAGIPVHQKAESIHILGATLWARVEAGTTVARVILHYRDLSKKELALKERENIGDWGKKRDLPGAARIWRGPDGQAVYDIEFMNPEPGKIITSIGLESAKEACGPFILAITLGP